MDAPKSADEPAAIDELDSRRRRLRYRAWHRGTKEADLLLGSFAERHLASFTAEQLERYEALLEQDDADLFDWLTRRAEPPPAQDSDVVRLLLAFQYTARPA